jgi:hypothetical protein
MPQFQFGRGESVYFQRFQKFLFNSSSNIIFQWNRGAHKRTELWKRRFNIMGEFTTRIFLRCALIFLYLINQIFYPLHGINRFAQFNRLTDSPTNSTHPIYSTHRLTTTHRLTRLTRLHQFIRLTDSLDSLDFINLFDSPTHSTHSTEIEKVKTTLKETIKWRNNFGVLFWMLCFCRETIHWIFIWGNIWERQLNRCDKVRRF